MWASWPCGESRPMSSSAAHGCPSQRLLSEEQDSGRLPASVPGADREIESGDGPELVGPVSVLDNSCVSSPTPGSIAAQYYNLLHACYPMPEDEDLRTGQIEQITQYLQKEGKPAAHQLALAAAGMGAAFSDNDAVQILASALMAELGKYNEPSQDNVRRQKPRLEKSQER